MRNLGKFSIFLYRPNVLFNISVLFSKINIMMPMDCFSFKMKHDCLYVSLIIWLPFKKLL